MFRGLKLNEIIDIDILQNIQDIFAKATHVAAITVDYEGKPITKPSNFTEFCNMIRCDEKLRDNCYKCDAYGGVQSLINRKPYIYKCHAGLIDFSVPIVIENSYVGAIMGGQVRIHNENDERIGFFGKISKWNKKEMLEKYNDVKYKNYEDVESAANLIYQILTYMVENEFLGIIKKELNNKTTKLMKEENRRIKLEKELKESELKLLQYQLNPHFIFNTLNTIQNFAYIEEAKKTQDIVYSFSDIMKYLLRIEDSNNAYIEEELNYVENYMYIQKSRFKDKINYNIDIDKKYYHLKCPFMLLQPIVENFVKYVVEQRIEGGYLEIKGYRKENLFIIDIKDNGDGISEEKINNILDGVDNEVNSDTKSLNIINKKLKCLYGENYGLKIYSENKRGEGLDIQINLPIDKEELDV